ncbi:MAG: hypothetical protein MPJ50_16135 [Pirellulales bacterium]|nr:hypothetical protein [Pirellulales bacterium]
MRINTFVLLLGLGLAIFPCGHALGQDTKTGDDVSVTGDTCPPVPQQTANSAESQPQDTRQQRSEGTAQGDPTVPSEEILRRIPQTPRGLQQQLVALPQLADVRLRGIVLFNADRGRALLEVGGRQISIPLKPREQQQRVPIPASQFLAMRPALEQRALLLSSDRQVAPKASPDGHDMSLQCSFVHDRVVYNLEAFSADTLMLKALPHDEFILVRAGKR